MNKGANLSPFLPAEMKQFLGITEEVESSNAANVEESASAKPKEDANQENKTQTSDSESETNSTDSAENEDGKGVKPSILFNKAILAAAKEKETEKPYRGKSFSVSSVDSHASKSSHPRSRKASLADPSEQGVKFSIPAVDSAHGSMNTKLYFVCWSNMGIQQSVEFKQHGHLSPFAYHVHSSTNKHPKQIALNVNRHEPWAGWA